LAFHRLTVPGSRILQAGGDHHQGSRSPGNWEHRLHRELGRVHQRSHTLRMLGRGGAQKDVLGEQEHLGTAWRKLLQQLLVSLL
jgi:hypothetical protein